MLEHRGRYLTIGRIGRWRLSDGRLEHWSDDRLKATIAVADIVSLHLAHDPAYRGGPDRRWRCDVVARDGTVMVIPSLVTGKRDAETVGPRTYVPLVTALIAACGAGCALRGGRRQPFSILLGLLGVGAAVLAAGLGEFAGMGADDLRIFVISSFTIGSIAGAPTAWRQWPRPFAPDAVPARLLPGTDG